jgi:hypothetical protein
MTEATGFVDEESIQQTSGDDHEKARLCFSARSLVLSVPALAAEPAAVDPDLAQFRAAYTSGDGLAYVVINDDKGEHIYRYGDASRLTAKKDTRGYMLFTCNAPHVFIPQKTEDKAALSKAVAVAIDMFPFVIIDDNVGEPISSSTRSERWTNAPSANSRRRSRWCISCELGADLDGTRRRLLPIIGQLSQHLHRLFQ